MKLLDVSMSRDAISRSLVAHGAFGCAGAVARGRNDEAALEKLRQLRDRLGAKDDRYRAVSRAIQSLERLMGQSQ